MTSNAPVMRASYMRETAAALTALGEQGEAARVRCSAEIARIHAASRLSFLPIADNLAILRAVEEVAGTHGLRAQGRTALLSASSSPLLRPIRDTALKLLASPAGVFRWGPQAWNLVFRNCGTLTWSRESKSRDENSGSLVLSNIPSLLDCTAWAETSAGAFVGGFELAGAPLGTVDITRSPATFHFELRWP